MSVIDREDLIDVLSACEREHGDSMAVGQSHNNGGTRFVNVRLLRHDLEYGAQVSEPHKPTRLPPVANEERERQEKKRRERLVDACWRE